MTASRSAAQRVAPPENDTDEERRGKRRAAASRGSDRPAGHHDAGRFSGSRADVSGHASHRPRSSRASTGLASGSRGLKAPRTLRNPSDNTLAVGPNHIVQIVNTQAAIFTKKGKKFDTTGRVLYGPVNTANFFKGFGGQCEAINNGDAVVRYDQIANRWLVVMPLFRRGPVRPDQPESLDGQRESVCQSDWDAGTAGYGSAALSATAATAGAADAARPARPGRTARRPRTGPAGPLFDVLCDQHERRSDGLVLPLRVPAAALSRLSEAGDLARRLLRADEHERRLHPEARLRRRARQDAQRRAGDRAVRRSSTASASSTTPTSTARRCRRRARPTS